MVRVPDDDFLLCWSKCGVEFATGTVRIRNRGGGVLVFSDDLEEILSLSDTIGVMFRGRIVGTMPAADANPLEVGRLMIGEEMRRPA